MASLLNFERKIVGNNILWITLLVSAGFIFACVTGGNLVHWTYLGFEVLMPFYVAIMVCEYVKTLCDPLMDVIIVHAKSMFFWVARRFIVVFGITGVLCIACMVALRITVLEFSLGELLIVYLSTAFFFSSLGVFGSFLSRQSHASTALCGTVWIFCLLVQSLVRLPAVAYIYPFIRFADTGNPIWLMNKAVIFFLGIGMWLWVYHICRKRSLNL